MPKRYSSEQVIKVLQRKGFVYISQKGSHVKFRKLGKTVLTAIIPAGKKEIPVGTFKSILRQSHLSWDEFEAIK